MSSAASWRQPFAGKRSNPISRSLLGGPRRAHPAVLRSVHQHHLHRDGASSRICRFNLMPTGKPRTTVYELSVSRDPERERRRHVPRRSDAAVRQRASRAKGSGDRAAPIRRPASPEPLAFLLADNQQRYRFTFAAGPAARPAHAPSTSSSRRRSGCASRGTGNCFEAEGGGHQGRLWFDRDSYDVLRVDIRLSKPFPVPLRGGHRGAGPIRVEI